jgi:hypothetical protein
MSSLVAPAHLHRRAAPVVVAALAYPAAWIAGLAVPVPAVEVDASAAQVLAGLAGHESGFAVRELLVHGVAAVTLAVVVLALAVALGRDGAGRAVKLAGLAAAAVSLVQVVVGLALVGVAVPGADAAASAALFDAINVLDGVKMLALAAFAGVAVRGARRTGLLSRRVQRLGMATAAALVVSAVGYLLALPAFALAAFASLPLLLVWVASAGLAVGRRAR